MSRLVTKPTKWRVRPAKTQINLDIGSVWSESSLFAWRNLESLATHWAHSEDSDAKADLSLRWAHTHFDGFVMSWLILYRLYYSYCMVGSHNASWVIITPEWFSATWPISYCLLWGCFVNLRMKVTDSTVNNSGNKTVRLLVHDVHGTLQNFFRYIGWRKPGFESLLPYEPRHKKPVFGVFDQIRLKPVCFATETS